MPRLGQPEAEPWQSLGGHRDSEPPQADHASRSLATASLAPATKPETRTAGASGLASHALSSWLLLAFQVARLSRAGILRSFLKVRSAWGQGLGPCYQDSSGQATQATQAPSGWVVARLVQGGATDFKLARDLLRLRPCVGPIGLT